MTENPLVSILMPTYNDADLISKSIVSILNLSYKKWELIIIDDGSQDNTEKMVLPFLCDPRISYYKLSTNKGQLNALREGAKKIHGKYVTLLHSDDLFNSNCNFEVMISKIEKEELDGLFADLIQINEKSNEIGMIKTSKTVDVDALGHLFINFGSNCISDVFFVRKTIFEKYIITQYLLWNMPYWFNIINNSIHLLKLKKTSPWYNYRVYSSNYIRSDIGKFEVTSGCLRTMIQLSDFFDGKIRINKGIQFWISKFISKLENDYHYCPYKGSYYELIVTVFELYNGTRIPINDYYFSLFSFYKNYPSTQSLEIPSKLLNNINNIYYGCDSRHFYSDLIENKLEPIYDWFLNNAIGGFNTLIVSNNKELQISKDILKFLNLKAAVILYER